MRLFRRKGFGIIRIVFLILFAALALYLLFRGIVHENIVSGIK